MKYALLVPIVASAVAAECGGTSGEESSDGAAEQPAEVRIDLAQALFSPSRVAIGLRADTSVLSVVLPVDRVEAHFTEHGWVVLDKRPFELTLRPQGRSVGVVREIQHLIRERV